MRIALHTKVRPDRVSAYEAAHQDVPHALTDAFRAAGVEEWTIWRSGTDLFHVIECPDHARLISHIEPLAVQREWELRLAELLDEPPADPAAATGLPVVWQLHGAASS